jgi:hypothetical protein
MENLDELKKRVYKNLEKVPVQKLEQSIKAQSRQSILFEETDCDDEAEIEISLKQETK